LEAEKKLQKLALLITQK